MDQPNARGYREFSSWAGLLPLAQPADYNGDYMSDKLESCANWLAAWMEHCAPGDAAMHDEVLGKIQRWVEVSL